MTALPFLPATQVLGEIRLHTDFSLEETKTVILPELVELTNDEHSHVRLAGLDTVVSILTMLDDGLLFAFYYIVVVLVVVMV